MTLNRALMDNPTTDDIPEEFDGTLDCSSLAICCSFNRYGTLLAVGCNDGRIVVFDFLTRIIAKNLQAHAAHPVSSVSWSRNCNKLVSGSIDNSIAIWHVLKGECLIRYTFKSSILKVQFNPRNENLVLACPTKHSSILLEVNYGTSQVQHKFLPTDKDDCEANMVASFDRRGQYIYSGGTKGRLAIFKCPTKIDANTNLEIVSSFKIQPTTAIREIEFGARNKKYFLVNSTDRTIRLYSCESALKAGINGNCEEMRKFQESVNKPMWKKCCFSGDIEASRICGGSARQHALYIWETENGTIKKMLEGPKGELLLDVQWHPLRPILASISRGVVSIWAKAEIENWSAYAPDFKELDDNEEYDERESEFDLEDEDNLPKSVEKPNELDDDEIIDVEEIKPDDNVISSDEEGFDKNTLVFIPITLEDHEIIDTAQPH